RPAGSGNLLMKIIHNLFHASTRLDGTRVKPNHIILCTVFIRNAREKRKIALPDEKKTEEGRRCG
ncbi:MAG: hypothetical protein IJG58_06840, partial [Oscillospiraceae bacterium]|nr:hypothetical protein [Oscillospiraceae bacterium]